MNKADLRALEKVFAAEIEGRMLPSKAAVYTRLADRGLVQKSSKTFTVHRFGLMTITGWTLTHSGRFEYCKTCEEI